ARPVRQGAHADPEARVLLGQEGVLDALQAVVAARGAFAAQPERAGRDREVVHQDQEVSGRIEGRIGAQRREGGAAGVHVGGGLEHTDGHALHLTFGDAGALAAAEGGKAPPRDDRIDQPEARIVTRRRVLGPRVAEADDGAQASALFAALGLLGLLGLLDLGGRGAALGFGLGWRAAFGRRFTLLLLTLTDLTDELGPGHLGRRFPARRRLF